MPRVLQESGYRKDSTSNTTARNRSSRLGKATSPIDQGRLETGKVIQRMVAFSERPNSLFDMYGPVKRKTRQALAWAM